MTQLEAIIICKILVEADGGCTSCARRLMEMFIDKFPQFKKDAIYIWNHTFTAEYDQWEDK